jgi:hypothetical protein
VQQDAEIQYYKCGVFKIRVLREKSGPNIKEKVKGSGVN